MKLLNHMQKTDGLRHVILFVAVLNFVDQLFETSPEAENNSNHRNDDHYHMVPSFYWLILDEGLVGPRQALLFLVHAFQFPVKADGPY